MVNLIKDNWDVNNMTGSLKAGREIITDRVENVKISGGMGSPIHSILIYSASAARNSAGIGKTSRRDNHRVSLDIRSMGKLSTAEEILKEVDRIVNSKIINPDSNFDILDPDTGFQPLHNKAIGLYRWVMDITLIKTNEIRPT